MKVKAKIKRLQQGDITAEDTRIDVEFSVSELVQVIKEVGLTNIIKAIVGVGRH